MVKVEDVKMWLESGDSMMVEMANGLIGQPLPSEENMVETLVFLGVFAMGFREMKLLKLADTYNRRADLFAEGLVPLGFSKQDYWQAVLKRTLHGSAKRILNRACSRTAYIMCELKREEDVEVLAKKAREEKEKRKN